MSALVSSPSKGSFRVELASEGKYRLLEQNGINPACPPPAHRPARPPGCRVADTTGGVNTALQTLSVNILPAGSKV